VHEGGEAGRLSSITGLRHLSCDTNTQRAIAWESQPEETAYEAFHAVIESESNVMGPTLERFEKELAHYFGMRYAVGVTTLLFASRRALGTACV